MNVDLGFLVAVGEGVSDGLRDSDIIETQLFLCD
jgi:hypothetical protein